MLPILCRKGNGGCVELPERFRERAQNRHAVSACICQNRLGDGDAKAIRAKTQLACSVAQAVICDAGVMQSENAEGDIDAIRLPQNFAQDTAFRGGKGGEGIHNNGASAEKVMLFQRFRQLRQNFRRLTAEPIAHQCIVTTADQRKIGQLVRKHRSAGKLCGGFFQCRGGNAAVPQFFCGFQHQSRQSGVRTAAIGVQSAGQGAEGLPHQKFFGSLIQFCCGDAAETGKNGVCKPRKTENRDAVPDPVGKAGEKVPFGNIRLLFRNQKVSFAAFVCDAKQNPFCRVCFAASGMTEDKVQTAHLSSSFKSRFLRMVGRPRHA
ncbi:unknown [Clostridium sp. CAG:448]|nr:unknown [Clostridium sp. CAG:448]